MPRTVFIVAIAALLASPVLAQQPATDKPYSFVVLGHVRGGKDGPNPKLPELFDKVRALKPAFVVLTGDMIWGDLNHKPSIRDTVLREWTHLDSALATLGVPAYRVSGNHDVQDVVTRDIYWQRYGKLPQVVALGKTRLILLASNWIPQDGDTAKMRFIRGTDLDTAQVTWLRTELAKPGFEHTFVFLHHLLWWEPDEGRWFTEVHPLLVAAKVDNVFSGDYGPLKFSTMLRDSIRYYQASMEGQPSLAILRGSPSSRLLSNQFDNFLEVRVNGPKPDVRVHTLAEVSSGMFTPYHYKKVNEPVVAPPAPLHQRLWAVINSPKRLIALALGLLIVFGFGWFARGLARR